jgi:hypothetical protein
MRWKTPPWLIILEAVLILAAVAATAYKAAMWISPLPVRQALEKRPVYKPDRKTRILDYCHKYPDRYA